MQVVALLAVLCGACALAYGAVTTEAVTLVDRPVGIPAHAQPGDRVVAFRFAGGTRAEVLAVDPDTGWLKVRGKMAGGVQAIGWISRFHVAGATEDSAGSSSRARRWGRLLHGPLAGCDSPRGTSKTCTPRTVVRRSPETIRP